MAFTLSGIGAPMPSPELSHLIQAQAKQPHFSSILGTAEKNLVFDAGNIPPKFYIFVELVLDLFLSISLFLALLKMSDDK